MVCFVEIAESLAMNEGARAPSAGSTSVATEVSVNRLRDLPADGLADLVAESEKDGFRFLRRLVADWESGANRFAQPGEALFAAVAGGRIIGVCGLNVDPYRCDGRVGRVRHLYVAVAFRRRGIGGLLVAMVIRMARNAFEQLRLRTNSAPAARFYEVLGFQRCDNEADCTHTLNLQSQGGGPSDSLDPTQGDQS
jgi:GNAT superfamily N-acetyltransferase